MNDLSSPRPLSSSALPGCVVVSSRRRDPEVRPVEDAAAVIARFVDLLYARRQVRAAFESCVTAVGYRDHSPGGFRSRAQAMRELGHKLGARGIAVDVMHVVVQGDMGMVHLQARGWEPGKPSQARVEIFRVAQGRIVEHWGVSRPLDEEA